MRFRVCFHLWCELTNTMRCNGMTSFMETKQRSMRFKTQLNAIHERQVREIHASSGKHRPKEIHLKGNANPGCLTKHLCTKYRNMDLCTGVSTYILRKSYLSQVQNTKSNIKEK